MSVSAVKSIVMDLPWRSWVSFLFLFYLWFNMILCLSCNVGWSIMYHSVSDIIRDGGPIPLKAGLVTYLQVRKPVSAHQRTRAEKNILYLTLCIVLQGCIGRTPWGGARGGWWGYMPLFLDIFLWTTTFSHSEFCLESVERHNCENVYYQSRQPSSNNFCHLDYNHH